MIKPSVGRIVWFYPHVDEGRDPNGQPLAGTIAKVIDDRVVNLTVSAADGSTYGAQHVALLQPGDELVDPSQAHATWMPFQLGQAAKTEAAIAGSPSLEPLQAKILELEQGITDKFTQFGESLDPILGEIGQRLSSLENQPPASPAPAPAPAPNAGDAATQQQPA